MGRRCLRACCASAGCRLLAPAPLVELALDAGYADQAHMTAEVTRLAGIHLSDFSKTARPLPRSVRRMPIDRTAAENFIWSAARLVDRHRYALLFADGPAEPVVEALRGYRNPDGGFGHAPRARPALPGQPARADAVRARDPQRGRRGRQRAGPRRARAGSPRSPSRTAAFRRCCPDSRTTRTRPGIVSGPGRC